MFFFVVCSQFFYSSKYFELGQVVRLSRNLPRSTPFLATQIAKVMIFSVMDIYTIQDVEVCRTEPAFEVVSFDVFLKRFVFKKILLEHKHRFAIKAKFAKIQPVHIYVVFT